MSQIKTTVLLPTLGAPARDTAVNDFLFDCGALDVVSAAATIETALEGFYNDVIAPNTTAVAEYIASVVPRTADACTFKHYNITGHLDGSVAGPPYRESTWQLAAPGHVTSGLPRQVSIALSFRADVSGIPEFGPGTERQRARRRGRIFLGPLSANAITAAESPDSAIVAEAAAAVISAAGKGLADFLLTNSIAWSIWSRKDQVLRPVVDGWTDRLFDVQRRRRTTAGIKVPWSVV